MSEQGLRRSFLGRVHQWRWMHWAAVVALALCVCTTPAPADEDLHSVDDKRIIASFSGDGVDGNFVIRRR